MKLQKGYTLIEILVALTIIGILFRFGYVSFRDFSRRQALAGIAKQVQGDLRLAQQMAASGQKPEDNKCTSPNTLNGYTFRVVAGGYEIIASCSGGALTDPSKSVVLPTDITISGVPSSILFKVLGHGTNIGTTNAVLTLTQTGTGSHATVTITGGGEIK